MAQPRSNALIEIADGVSVCCPDDNRLMTPYVLREQGDWFEDEIRFFRQLVKPHSVFIDIGANYGLYSLSVARRGARHVWSFEPCAATAACLRESVEANGFSSQVTLVQKALSDRSGAGRLLNQENSELNALLASDDERGEAVGLTSLDEECARHGWDGVDLVKIDAEGHELRVIAGGQRFFTDRSPLVMCEIKAGASLDLAPVKRLLELGYRCYRLAPGPQVLIPQDPDAPFDVYQLNVFCCKSDRAAILAERGLLVESIDASPFLVAGAWCEFLRSFPYGLRLFEHWQRRVLERPLPDWADYQMALDLYACSRSTGEDAARRFGALRESFRLLDALVKRQTNLPRLLSYARVAADFGLREAAVQAFDLALKSVAGRQAELVGGEPFLPPSADLERSDPEADAVRWTVASALDAFERLRGYSSYFSRPDITVGISNDLQSMGLRTAQMARRGAVAAVRLRMLQAAEGGAKS